MKSLTFSCLICALNLSIFSSKIARGCLNGKELLQTPKVNCLKVAEHNRDRPNDTCVLIINTIVYDLSLSESTFNKDAGGYEDTELLT